MYRSNDMQQVWRSLEEVEELVSKQKANRHEMLSINMFCFTTCIHTTMCMHISLCVVIIFMCQFSFILSVS